MDFGGFFKYKMILKSPVIKFLTLITWRKSGYLLKGSSGNLHVNQKSAITKLGS